MNRWSCHSGIPDCADGFSERRETKNDVAMMSNCQPSFRAITSAFGTLGDSMKPKRSRTVANLSLMVSMRTLFQTLDQVLQRNFDTPGLHGQDRCPPAPGPDRDRHRKPEQQRYPCAF